MFAMTSGRSRFSGLPSPFSPSSLSSEIFTISDDGDYHERLRDPKTVDVNRFMLTPAVIEHLIPVRYTVSYL
jgi:hypothetical protein